jgi:hypothetical protein
MRPSVPAGAGAIERRAAILCACSALSHVDDEISHQELFRFRKDSIRDRHAVVSGANDLGLVWNARPSEATNTPSSFSSLLNERMKATFAFRSSFGHFMNQSQVAWVPFIIRMYFMACAPFDSATTWVCIS